MNLFVRTLKHLVWMLNRGKLLHVVPDSAYLKMMYMLELGQKLDLDNPKTFNEKLQWLKINDRKPIYTTMVDKYEVKSYVANLIGEEYLIPTLGVWDSFDDIEFDSLPNAFVLKCTHDSGGLVICKNKKDFNISEAKKKIEQCLKFNFYWHGREWPYKDVKPRIIAEPYIVDKELTELRDYKFFCFSGRVKLLKIDFNRFTNHQANYYSRDCKLLPVGETALPYDAKKEIKFPSQYEKMVSLAEKLSTDIPFVRVDFYQANEKVLFGEITFYPTSGFGKWSDDNYDVLFGEWIDLNSINKQYLSDTEK